MNPAINRLRALIENRTATVGVCGMGNVGLPLAAAAAKAGFTLIGFDVDKIKTETLNSGTSYIDAWRARTSRRWWRLEGFAPPTIFRIFHSVT